MTAQKIFIRLGSLIVLVLLIQSCASTKYLEDDEYLLQSYSIEDHGSEIPIEEYKNYIKQKPNKKFLGWKLWLSVYNLSGENDSTWINQYLKKQGEPPVVYSEDLSAHTSQQLELFLSNKGFFNSRVTDTTEYKGRKASVTYKIETGEPYKIKDITYFFKDAALSKFILSDSIPHSLIAGEQYDADNFQAERVRIESILRNQGYYNFSSDYVYFEGDSTVGSHQVDIVVGIENYPQKDSLGGITGTAHPVSRIRNVYLKTAQSPSVVQNRDADLKMDTTEYGHVYVISESGTRIKHELITQKNYIIPGSLYNARREQQTYRNLTSLSAFRMVDYTFKKVPGEENLLDCEIKLIPSIRQAFTGGIEGTTSGGNIGAAGNLNYQHRNLFGGSEKFDLTFLGAIETIPEGQGADGEDIGTMQEFGAEAQLNLPQFLLPFKTDQFIRKFNPETNINLAYNFQKRPKYTRSTVRASFGYRWRGNSFLTHSVYPFEISLISTPFLDDSYRDLLFGTYLYYSYLPHFISSQRYRLVYSNQKLNKSRDFQYLRFNVETAGNIMRGIYSMLGSPDSDPVLKLFGIEYAQYFRSDIDMRNYNYLGQENSLVSRLFLGAAVPYLNSTAIPFEKQYFGGGANSIRAWRVKNLGPGSFIGDTISEYPNQTADLKIEVNLEYRFKLFWKMEGALFVDAGNIWSLSKEDDRKGAQFDLKRFYKEFAVGTGFGLRFDFNYFLFRIDVGIPMVDPSYPEGERWIPAYNNRKFSDLGFNFAIGYPF